MYTARTCHLRAKNAPGNAATANLSQFVRTFRKCKETMFIKKYGNTDFPVVSADVFDLKSINHSLHICLQETLFLKFTSEQNEQCDFSKCMKINLQSWNPLLRSNLPARSQLFVRQLLLWM